MFGGCRVFSGGGVLLGLLGLSISSINAAEYVPTTLPEDASGTSENPSWHFESPRQSAVAYEIKDQLLRVDATSMVEEETGPSWSIGGGWGRRFGNPWDAWRADPSTGTTIDICLKVEQEVIRQNNGDRFRGGCGLSLADGTYMVVLFFGVNGITVSGEKVVKIEDCDNRKLRTYRIAMKEGLASVYIDDREEPIVEDLPMQLTEVNGVNRICFGTISKFVTGLYEIAGIKWSNSEASFSRPENLLRSTLANKETTSP